jgi:hypothetical protein
VGSLDYEQSSRGDADPDRIILVQLPGRKVGPQERSIGANFLPDLLRESLEGRRVLERLPMTFGNRTLL